jgi:arylsulfatase A-like enzyme
MHSSTIGKRSWVGLVAALLACIFTALNAAQQPNILFIFADDQSYDTFGPGDDPQVQTPHLDRLASQGTRFTHCFNMGSWSGAVCVASRGMLNSGRTLWHAYDIQNSLGKLKQQPESIQNKLYDTYWSRRMSRLGYETYFSGKWHVSVDAHKLFDHVVHVRPGMPRDSRGDKTTTVGYHRPVEGEVDDWHPADPKFGGFWEGGKHWSEVLADDAVGFLQAEGKKATQGSNKPFFMYLAFNAPHDPRQSPQEFLDRYPLDDIKIPVPFQAKYPFLTSGLNPNLRDEALAVYPRTEYAVKVHRKEYYSLITHMDEQIGKIIAELDRQGLRDNTWIIFTADHGLACGHHGLFGKQNMYDHSLRPPFFIVGPGAPAGKEIDTPIFLQDLMATSLELGGDEKRNGVEFRSLVPLLNGKEEQPAPVYGAYLETQRAIRHDGWKLILYPKLKVKRLYNYANDRHEIRDRAGEPGQLERMKSLFAFLRQEQERFDDPLDLTEIYPELAN